MTPRDRLRAAIEKLDAELERSSRKWGEPEWERVVILRTSVKLELEELERVLDAFSTVREQLPGNVAAHYMGALANTLGGRPLPNPPPVVGEALSAQRKDPL